MSNARKRLNAIEVRLQEMDMYSEFTKTQQYEYDTLEEERDEIYSGLCADREYSQSNMIYPD